jgi:uncharacterized membrane protein
VELLEKHFRVPAPRPSVDAAATAPLVERIVRAGVVLAVLGVAAQSVGYLTSVVFFDGDVQALNADDDHSMWAWASSTATFAAGFAVFLLALVAPVSRRLLAFAALLAFLSLDDVLRVHERIGTTVREQVFGLGEGWGRLTWPALYFPLLAIAFLTLWRLSDEAPKRGGRSVKLGLGLLVAAVATELVTAPLYIATDDDEGAVRRVQVTLEEGAELAGWIVIATGLATLAVVRIAEAARRGGAT